MTTLVANRAEGAGPVTAPAVRAGDRELGCLGRQARLGLAAQALLPSRGGRWLAGGFIAAGMLMIPWLFLLATQLPASTRAWHWPLAWVGLDSLEALGLLATGALLARRDDRYRLAAMATATLLVTDAWFDVTTAAPGMERLLAIAMAVFPELPVASFCLTLALRARPARDKACGGRACDGRGSGGEGSGGEGSGGGAAAAQIARAGAAGA